MQTLAELIGKPGGDDLGLLQATVTAVSGGTATIHFGNAAETIAGVAMVASAGINAGDTAWVLRTGGALMIIGKLESTPLKYTGGRIVIDGGATTDTLQMKGSGAAISLFMRDDQAHYFAVYANAVALRFWQNLTSTEVHAFYTNSVTEHGSCKLGPASGLFTPASDYAVFTHTSRFASTTYAFLAGLGGDTYVNASSGHANYIRINNTTVMDLDSGRIRIGQDSADIQTMVIRNYQQGDWTHAALIIVANTSEARTTYWSQSQGAAPIWKNWVGDFEARDQNDTGFTNVRGNSFGPSRAIYKKDQRRAEEALPKAERKRRLRKLETIHHRWKGPGRHCANCMVKPDRDCPVCHGDPNWAPPHWLKGQESGWFSLQVEEVAEHFPELVGWKTYPDDPEPVAEAVDLMGLIAVLWEEARDFDARLDALEKKKGVA